MPRKKNDSYILGSLKEYFLNINNIKPKLYLDVHSIIELDEHIHKYQVSPETFIVYHILYEYFDFKNIFEKWIHVNMIIFPESKQFECTTTTTTTTTTTQSESSSSSIVKVNIDLNEEQRKLFELKKITNHDDNNDEEFNNIYSCDHPLIIIQKNTIISGLSSILRFIFKFISINDVKLEIIFNNLLGFRGGCLQACSESSIWTKFCEVDIIKRMIRNMVHINEKYYKHNNMCSPADILKLYIPKDLLRLEYHLCQPVRIHNFRKKIQANKNGNNITNIYKNLNLKINNNGCIHGLDSNEPIEQQIPHDFAEGPNITLADLILFPCIDLAFIEFGQSIFQLYLPNVFKWMNRIRLLNTNRTLSYRLEMLYTTTTHRLPISEITMFEENECIKLNIELPIIPKESLYNSDTSRYNPRLKLFTKQDDIIDALKVLSEGGIELMNPDDINNDESINLNETLLDWSKIPLLAQPGIDGGELPEHRREKKNQQLSNLIQMIEFIYKKYKIQTTYSSSSSHEKIKIVDFCSGGGHLGILIGYLFQDTQVYLVENKEESMRRGRGRVEAMGLTNISFIQCNLINFHGHFNIGVGLHACGSSTDLILSKCAKIGASFVVCPCCYGKIQCGGGAGDDDDDDDEIINKNYPKSNTFQQIYRMNLEKYLILAHSADQTHDEKHKTTNQGRLSMRAIDTDRLKAFDELGYYKTWLRRIIPSSASPKNHILIGLANY